MVGNPFFRQYADFYVELNKLYNVKKVTIYFYLDVFLFFFFKNTSWTVSKDLASLPTDKIV